MLKILQIIPSLNKGGAERLVLDICNQLSKVPDVDVKLITFRADNAYTFLTDRLDHQVIPAKVTPSIRGKMTVEVGELQREIERFKPDIIHSHLFESEMVLSQINYPTAKRIVHFHDNMVQFENFSVKSLSSKARITNFFEKQIVLKSYNRQPIQLIAISGNTMNYISRVLPNSYKKNLLHNAIDTNRFTPSASVPEKPMITTIGSLVDKKGQELCIRIVHELHKRGILVHVQLLGDGPNRATLQQQTSAFGLNQFVHFEGNVDYPEDYLKNSTIYVHTALYEPFGLVLIEAMASGLPVVCTDGKGNRDLIKEGENGFMVWERNPKLLADKIEMLLNNQELRLKIGQNARKFAEGFGIDKYVDELLKVYVH